MVVKFCPQCGNKLVKRLIHNKQRLFCAKCGFIYYDNPIPAVGAVIIKDNKILCTKRAFPPFAGWWDLPGGFLEGSEDPEKGLKREVKEETGLNITPLTIIGIYKEDRYYKSKKGPSVISIFYLGQIKNGILKPGDDVAEVKFFPYDKLPKFPFPHYKILLKDLKKYYK